MITARNAAIVLLALSLAACKTKPVKPAYSLQTSPAVGMVATAAIGDELLEQGDAAVVDALVLRNDVTIDDMTFKQGRYALTSSTEDQRMFGRVNVTRRGKLSIRGKLFLFSRDVGAQKLCVSRSLCVHADYVIDKTTSYSRARARQMLIYSGRIGDKVTLGYREFANGAARPALSNDAAYDLAESRILTYKGARVEVIDATGSEISYRVLSGFE